MRILTLLVAAIALTTATVGDGGACSPRYGGKPPFETWTDGSDLAQLLLNRRERSRHDSERARELPTVLKGAIQEGVNVALVRPAAFEVSTLAPTPYEIESIGEEEAKRSWEEYARAWRFGVYRLEILRVLKGAPPAQPTLPSTHRFFALPETSDIMGNGGGHGPCPYFMGLNFHRSYLFSWDAAGSIVQIVSLNEDFVREHLRKSTEELIDEAVATTPR